VQPQILAAVGHGLFILASTAIAVRLLLLWRRTRQWPELLIGSGLLMPGAVTLPCAALAGLGSATVGEIHIPVLAVGLFGAAAGIALVMAFTWRVFRPASRVAAAFALGTGTAAFVTATLFVHALATAPADAAPAEVHRAYGLGIMGLFQIWYAWMAIEALGEWQRARRRFALGLSDPVVVNRFGLWGSLGVVQLFNGAVSIAFEASGHGMMTEPLPALWIAVVGLVTGALMLLTFVPPTRYREWVRAKHAHRVATASA
jgi:hypothetical protein